MSEIRTTLGDIGVQALKTLDSILEKYNNTNNNTRKVKLDQSTTENVNEPKIPICE